ncbi:MAG: tetratricopeptide repeat protein [Peptococcaceae bacterium]|nr:tetratricopeptide repeat protein [Peptococcaceae bacterium]
MKTFGLYILLSLLTGNPLLALVILLLVFFLAERRFIGILPDVLEPWRRLNRTRQLEKEIRVNPADGEACLELGEIYFRRGLYEKSLLFLKNASDKMAGHPLFHFYLGASYYHLGKIEEGKEEIEKALEINPRAGRGEPCLYLIKICLAEGQPEAKIDHLFNQLMLAGSPEIFYKAAKIFAGANDKEKARRLFRETIENYEACRGALRRVYRKWAILSRIRLILLGRPQK